MNLYNLFINRIFIFNLFMVIFFPGKIDEYCSGLKGGWWNRNKNFSNLSDVDAPVELRDCSTYAGWNKIIQIFYAAVKVFSVNFILCTTSYSENYDNELRLKRANLNHNILNLRYKHTIDLAPELFDSELFYDGVHLNEKGCFAVAKALIRHINIYYYIQKFKRVSKYHSVLFE